MVGLFRRKHDAQESDWFNIGLNQIYYGFEKDIMIDKKQHRVVYKKEILFSKGYSHKIAGDLDDGKRVMTKEFLAQSDKMINGSFKYQNGQMIEVDEQGLFAGIKGFFKTFEDDSPLQCILKSLDAILSTVASALKRVKEMSLGSFGFAAAFGVSCVIMSYIVNGVIKAGARLLNFIGDKTLFKFLRSKFGDRIDKIKEGVPNWIKVVAVVLTTAATTIFSCVFGTSLTVEIYNRVVDWLVQGEENETVTIVGLDEPSSRDGVVNGDDDLDEVPFIEENPEYAAVEQSASNNIVFIFSILIGVFVTKERTGPSPMPVTIFDFLKNTGVVYGTMKTGSFFIEQLYKILPSVLKLWIFDTFGVAPGSALCDPQVEAWMEAVSVVHKRINLDPSEITADNRLRLEILDLYYTKSSIASRMEYLKATREEFLQFHTMEKTISHATKVVWAIEGDTYIRQRPAVVFITGMSTVGKSYILKSIAKDVLKVNDGSIWTRTASDDFWSGYSAQRVIIYDDFGQSDAKEVAELVPLVSTNKFTPPMPSVEDPAIGIKGTKIKAEVVLIATNSAPDRDYGSISCGEAIANRLDICVQALVNRKYIVDNKIDFELVKSVTKETGCPCPHLLFKILNPIDGKPVLKVNGDDCVYTYAQLVEATKINVNKRRADFETQISKPETVTSLNWLTIKQENVFLKKITLCLILQELIGAGYIIMKEIINYPAETANQLYELISKRLGFEPSNVVDVDDISGMESKLPYTDTTWILGPTRKKNEDRIELKEIPENMRWDDAINKALITSLKKEHDRKAKTFRGRVVTASEDHSLYGSRPLDIHVMLKPHKSRVLLHLIGLEFNPKDHTYFDRPTFEMCNTTISDLSSIKSVPDYVTMDEKNANGDSIVMTLDDVPVIFHSGRNNAAFRPLWAQDRERREQEYAERRMRQERADQERKERNDRIDAEREAEKQAKAEQIAAKKRMADPTASILHEGETYVAGPKAKDSIAARIMEVYNRVQSGENNEVPELAVDQLLKERVKAHIVVKEQIGLPDRVKKLIEEGKTRVKVRFYKIKSAIVNWAHNLPRWARILLVALGVVASAGIIAFALYKLVRRVFYHDETEDFEDVEAMLQSAWGQQRDAMLKLVSVCNKDINERLNTMPMEELRDIVKTRVDECGAIADRPLEEILNNVSKGLNSASSYRKYIRALWENVPEGAVYDEPEEIYSIGANTSVPDLMLITKKLVSGIKNAPSGTMGHAYRIINMTPRLFNITYDDVEDYDQFMDLIDDNDMPSLEIGEVDVTDGLYGECDEHTPRKDGKNKRSKSAKKWKENHKSFIKRYKNSSHYKFKVRGRHHKGSTTLLATANRALAIGQIKLDNGDYMHFLPVRGHVILVPHHFFYPLEKGQALSYKIDGYEFHSTFDPRRIRRVRYKSKDGTVSYSELCLYDVGSTCVLFDDNLSKFPTDAELASIAENLCSVDLVHRTGQVFRADAYIESPYALTGADHLRYAEGSIVTTTNLREPGDCGLPVMVTTKDNKVKILGVHVLATKARAQECAMLITKEMLLQMLSSYPTGVKDVYAVYHAYRGLIENVETPICGNIHTLGAIGKECKISKTSTLKKSKLNGKIKEIPNEFEPSVMSCDDPRVQWKEIHQAPKPIEFLTAERYALEKKPFPLGVRQLATRWTIAERILEPDAAEVRELTNHEALNGYGNMRKLDMQSSPGYEWKVGQRRKRTDWIDMDNKGVLTMKPELEEAVNTLYDNFSQGKACECLWNDALKDECRKSEKIRIAKTRGFTMSSLALLIVVRRILGSSLSHDIGNYKHSQSAIGLNPYSPDWDDMIKELLSISTTGFDGDWEKFDSGVGLDEWEDMMEVDLAWYKIHQGGISSPHELRIRCAYASLMHRLTLVGKYLYVMHGGVGSGGPGTSTFNSRVNINRVKLGYIGLKGARVGAFDKDVFNDLLIGTLAEFKGKVLCKVLGDDFIAAVNKDIQDWFNGQSYAQWFYTYGRTLTEPTKKGPPSKKCKSIVEMEFLSNKTIIKISGNCTYWAQPVPGIEDKCLNWVRIGENCTEVENIAMRVTSVLMMQTSLTYEQYMAKVLWIKNYIVKYYNANVWNLVYFLEYPDLMKCYQDRKIMPEEEGDVTDCLAEYGITPGYFHVIKKQRFDVNKLIENLSVLFHTGRGKPAVVIPAKPSIREGVADGEGDTQETSGIMVDNVGPPTVGGNLTRSTPRSYSAKPLTVPDLANRFVQVDVLRWDVGGSVGDILWDGSLPWSVIKLHNTIRTPFEKFRFVKPCLELRAEISGTMFHAGQLVMYFTPLLSREERALHVDTSRSTQSIQRHVMLNPGVRAPSILQIPFIHPRETLNVSLWEETWCNMGTAGIAIFNPLTIDTTSVEGKCQPTTVNINLFARLTNVEVAVPVGVEFKLPYDFHGVGSSKMMKLIVTGNNNTVPVEFGSDDIDQQQSASITPMDNPSWALPPPAVTRRGIPPFSYAEGVEYMDKLQLRPEYLTTREVRDTCAVGDEMSLIDLASIPTYCETFRWECESGQGLLAWGFVSPTDCLHHPTYNLDRDLPLVEFISKGFYLWTGTIVLTFDVICSHVHAGLLMCTFHAGLFEPPREMYRATAEYMREITVDKEPKRYICEMPYIADTTQKFIINGEDSLAQGSTGVWCLWIVNKLVAPSSAAQNIEINLYKSVGPDFKLSYLGANGVDMLPKKVIFHGTLGQQPSSVAPRYAEDYSSVKDFCKRFTLYQKIDLNGGLLCFAVSDLVNKIAALWNPMYASWAGNIRIRIIHALDVAPSVWFVPSGTKISPAGDGLLAKNLLPTSDVNAEDMRPLLLATAASNHTVGYIDVEVPFVTPYKFIVRAKSWKTNDEYNEYTNTGYIYVGARSLTGKKSEVHYMYVSGGDDFRFLHLVTIPPLKWATTTIVDKPMTNDKKVPEFIVLHYGWDGAGTPPNYFVVTHDLQAKLLATADAPLNKPGYANHNAGIVKIESKDLTKADLVGMGIMLATDTRQTTPGWTLHIRRGDKFKLAWGNAWPKLIPSKVIFKPWMKTNAAGTPLSAVDYDVLKTRHFNMDSVETVGETTIQSLENVKLASSIDIEEDKDIELVINWQHAGMANSSLRFMIEEELVVWFRPSKIETVDSIKYAVFVDEAMMKKYSLSEQVWLKHSGTVGANDLREADVVDLHR